VDVISKAESLQILEGTLREQALVKYAAQLAGADIEEKRRIFLQMDKDVRQELRNYLENCRYDSIIH
jgi:hypothetical protein